MFVISSTVNKYICFQFAGLILYKEVYIWIYSSEFSRNYRQPWQPHKTKRCTK